MSVSDIPTLVKQAADIVDVIGQVVPLRRSGNRYVGLCPFHQEKTPSFHVDAENQLYHCFGCGVGGDVLSFVMKYRNLSFGEALTSLAERYHVALPQGESSRYRPAASAESLREKEELHRVLELAGDFFYDQLHHSEAGIAAREYLRKRSLPADLVEAERLGYAPDSWDALSRHLSDAGVDLELGIKAGLLGKSARDRVFDRFRHRVIFPIRDERGRIVAFGGRSLSGEARDEPKYLNSPETAVYHKGRMLYQLAKAREACRQIRQVVLVEGYMDLLAFHAQGFYRVAATLGTALTSQQVRLLGRVCDEVVLAYDGDEAGQRAMLRALPFFLQEQLAATCIRFPDGMDPDDYLRKEGVGAFELLLKQREDLGAYAIRGKLDSWDGSTSGKTRVLSELRPIVGAVRQPVLKSEYLRLIADRLSLSEAVIQNQFRFWDEGARKPFARSRTTFVTRLPQTQSLEENILRAMIKHPALIEEMKTSEVLDHFQSAHLKVIAETMMQVPYPPFGTFNASAVYDILSDSEPKELFTRLLLESENLSDAEVHIRDWLDALCERKTKQARRNLQEALREAERQGNVDQVRQLLLQIQDLNSVKKRVKESADNV